MAEKYAGKLHLLKSGAKERFEPKSWFNIKCRSLTLHCFLRWMFKLNIFRGELAEEDNFILGGFLTLFMS